MNLWDTAIKNIFFPVCLFLLLTITGRNEAVTGLEMGLNFHLSSRTTG